MSTFYKLSRFRTSFVPGVGVPPYRHSERSVGIQRSESKSSACVRSTLHQAIGRAKLRQDFLPVLDLRAYARLCGVIARASKVLSNKRTLVAFAYAPLEQCMKDKEKPLREPAQRTLRT